MPGRDGTGPMGMGPITGRGTGFCRVSRGAGRLGLGLGLRRGFGSNMNLGTPEERKKVLEEQKTILKNQLDFLNDELDSMKKKD